MPAVETVTLEPNDLHRLDVPEPPPPVSRRGSQHRPEPPALVVGITANHNNVSRRNSASVSSAPAAETAPATSNNQHGHISQPEEATRTRTRPPAATILLTMAPLCLSVLLSALDLTITTPAIPSVASALSSASGYAWVGSAFSLAMTAVTPVWATVADIWGRKPVMLAAQAVFFAGSMLCARAPTMAALIAGRAVQGVGASGMGTMVNTIICDTFSMRDRGLYLAVTSIVWAVGSAVGPVLGGIFTTKLDWRWCFYINSIDWAGSFLIVGAALMILLGLEFGDITFPWSSATVISLLVFGSLTVGLFVLAEWKLAGANPIIPLRLFRDRSSVASYAVFSCGNYILTSLAFYLPLYSQSVLGADALTSGVHLIPLIVSCSLTAAATGTLIQKTGRYLPLMYVAQISLAVGTGLLIYLKFGEPLTKLVVFQVLVGLGVGMNMEPPLLAAQAAAAKVDTAVVIATMGFIRNIATSVAIVGGGVIFQNRMSDHYEELVAEVGEKVAVSFKGDQASASVGLISSLSMQDQIAVRQVYFDSFRAVWIMCVVVAGLSLVANMFVRAHHLSAETQAVVLGVDRVIEEESRRQTHRELRGNSITSRSIELQEGAANQVRLRS
ncbi:major facilitator superfamily domain-containing protein [Apiospora rasikravindrae]|uniref:Major facilitator superfamily domain-containing protein n=1 Tax=Apiospora rasikravindrae TaxID=990691 RepID=A0ABR1U392_9PEZI